MSCNPLGHSRPVRGLLYIWEDNIKEDLKDTAREDADWIDSARERFDDHVVRTITRFLDLVFCALIKTHCLNSGYVNSPR
jgi:hypothetical protein